MNAPRTTHTPDGHKSIAMLRAENQRLREALQDMTYGEDCRKDSRFVTAPRWAYDNAKNVLADCGIFTARDFSKLGEDK